MNSKYKARFEGYTASINWPDPTKPNPNSEAADVTLSTLDGRKLTANFVTKPFLDYVFSKNSRTGECASGTYFCMKDGMIVVEKITERTVKATIDDLINNYEVDFHFKEIK
tara:strand:+ start:51404 stop:51736 length:333 start_codon:yes stop_codon:yes gene_type:complete